MIRLFIVHEIREVQELEGGWDFSPMTASHNSPVSYAYHLPVPGCWEMHPQFTTYRGRGAYRRWVDVAAEGHFRLCFKGVSHTADVYWDGDKIAHHYNAYTEFSAVMPCVSKGKHELVVVVDNSFRDDSTLHVPNDYFTYGGIIRPVVWERIPAQWVQRVEFAANVQNGEWFARITVHVGNLADRDTGVSLMVEISDVQILIPTGVIVAHSSRRFEVEALIPHVQPWSHENPNLYPLSVRLWVGNEDCPQDDLVERVGFRTIRTENGRILVNEQPVTLRGFNRHEDHPMVGAAIPYPLMVQDMEWMLDMGINALRTSHYPNDERFLDLCDERGIYVWEENHARGLSLEQMQRPHFMKQCADCNREMVESHMNHPAIILWGILNECASHTDEGHAIYEAQFGQIRSLDDTRLLTFASDKRQSDRCLDLVDVVSLNLYPLWYSDEEPAELLDRAKLWIEDAGGHGKPLIMSEFGADGFYGFRDRGRVKGSEERQADILRANLAVYCKSQAGLSGVFIWQFCDARTTEGTGWLMSRCMTQNSKGVVDRYRRPKLAYDTVKEYFHSMADAKK